MHLRKKNHCHHGFIVQVGTFDDCSGSNCVSFGGIGIVPHLGSYSGRRSLRTSKVEHTVLSFLASNRMYESILLAFFHLRH